jgi:archaellum biogenesis ATPase FlaH
LLELLQATQKKKSEYTDKHAEYVILIALARQQLSRERASMLRYTCSALLTLLVTTVAKAAS